MNGLVDVTQYRWFDVMDRILRHTVRKFENDTVNPRFLTALTSRN